MEQPELVYIAKFFSSYTSIEKNHIAFDGEIKAIQSVLKQLAYQPSTFSKVAILCDSQAAISAITSFTSTPICNDILDWRKLIRNLTAQNKEIVLQWIPSHCGIVSNEMADTITKKGTLIPPYHSEVPYARAASTIHYKLRKTHRDLLESSNHQWKDRMQALPNWPRREAVAQFRLATGHDCLAKHLHHISILRNPNCTLSNQGIMDSNHLNICSTLTSTTLTDRYWEAREKMMAAIPQ